MKLLRRTTASRPPDAAPTVIGNLDRFGNGRLQGWAANADDHSENLDIQVWYDGRVLQTSTASFERLDVTESGISGSHGFDFLLNKTVETCFDPAKLEIRAARSGSDTSTRISGLPMDDICSFLRHDSVSCKIFECERVWGGQGERRDPQIGVYHNAIYMPFEPYTFIDANPNWGLYREDGRLIEEAAYRRGEGLALVGQCERLDVEKLDIQDAPYPTMIYGGPVIAHYGHFILTTLARNWALDGVYPALYHSDPSIHEHRTPFVRQLLEASGARATNSYSFDKPTRIKTLLVPEAALIEQHSISPHYASAMASVARHLPSSPPLGLDKVYLSKERLTSGVTGLDGEAYVSRKLKDAGFSIIFPEQRSLAEQIQIFREARLIVGIAGSAFHTQVFTRRFDAKRLILSYDEFVNANFKLIDRLTGGESVYFSIKDHIVAEERAGFQMHYRLKNASAFADELIALSDEVLA